MKPSVEQAVSEAPGAKNMKAISERGCLPFSYNKEEIAMKRGADHWWHLVRYDGDIAIYASCKCGYRYPCSSSKRNDDGSWSFVQEVTKLFPYCPTCGARKKWYSDDITIKKGYYSWE